MKTAIAQIRLRTGDFEYNFKKISDTIKNTDCDFIVFPNIEDLGCKDLIYDNEFQKAQADIFEKLANVQPNKSILVGDILIRNRDIETTEDGFFIINGQTVYVDEIFRDDVACDLYVLSKNKYFAMNKSKEFIESIYTTNNFIYINSITMADSDICAGGSFIKNKDNELISAMPLCEEAVVITDFQSIKEINEYSFEEEIFKVLTFALKEYCEITGFKKVLIGLSGGIDSALVAALAVYALGAENVLGIMMPSMYSSEGSVKDSVKLAENLDIKVEKMPITPLFKNFMENIGKDNKGDLAEENLQARLRAVILMFFSNRENRLLLNTSNKSESAMGFGTLYGDLAGGLNLLADLTKTNVYKLCDYINRNGEIIPREIIEKAPSAELRPNQKDSDRLPEYAILDNIIEMYLEQNIPTEEIYEKYDKNIVDDVIKKIWRNQFKRKQTCLGVRLTERSFCKGTDLPVMQRFY